jgi:hypothetical protein
MLLGKILERYADDQCQAQSDLVNRRHSHTQANSDLKISGGRPQCRIVQYYNSPFHNDTYIHQNHSHTCEVPNDLPAAAQQKLCKWLIIIRRNFILFILLDEIFQMRKISLATSPTSDLMTHVGTVCIWEARRENIYGGGKVTTSFFGAHAPNDCCLDKSVYG